MSVNDNKGNTKKSLLILLTSHGEATMESIFGLVSQLPGVEAKLKVLNGQPQSYPGSDEQKADLLIYFLGAKAEMELEALARQGRQACPTLIVCEQNVADPRLMRLAMQAGVRDFITGPQSIDDTLAAVRKIIKEDNYRHPVAKHTLTAVVNAKGGAGACALAYAFATR